jgi:hypothetical protein
MYLLITPIACAISGLVTPLHTSDYHPYSHMALLPSPFLPISLMTHVKLKNTLPLEMERKPV